MSDPGKDAEAPEGAPEEEAKAEHTEVLPPEDDAPAPEAADEAPEPVGDDALEAALAEVERLRDVALRAEAEMQNIKRRAERDVENAHKFGVEKFLTNLLPVVDSIEKAIEASEASEMAEDDPLLEGVRLCHKLLVDVLSRENIEVVDPEGQPFDPNEHEALTMVENPEVEPNTVVTVVQKGYKLNARLVRPAMVMVSR